MALYFLKGERDLPKNPPVEHEGRKPNSRARAILLTAAIFAILLATLIQASGLLHPWESRLPKLLGIPSPAKTRTVFLSLPIGPDGGTDPMDVALVLRGLSMLHPSLILVASTNPISGDAAQLLQGVKDQLREKGIPLAEAASPSAESPWRPVPLCRYFPPGSSERQESLPSLPGRAPADGTLRYLPAPTGEPGILPLLSCTSSGEIAGSLWWEGLMQGQPNAPVWLLANRLLLLPNHAPLPFVMGGLRTPRDLSPPRSVTSDDFLLKMEEKERGSLSPDFDSLWEHAVVVVGPPSLLPMTSALAAIRESTAWGAIPLLWQGVSLFLLIGLVTFVFFLPQRPALLLVTALFIMGLSGAWWLLHHGLLPPILPWLISVVAALTGCLIGKRFLQIHSGLIK